MKWIGPSDLRKSGVVDDDAAAFPIAGECAAYIIDDGVGSDHGWASDLHAYSVVARDGVVGGDTIGDDHACAAIEG